MTIGGWKNRVKLLLHRLRGGRASKAETFEEWEELQRGWIADDLARVLPHLPEQGAVMVDVGANLGVFTARVLEHRPDLRAFLFEPVGALHDHCKARFAGNPNVEVERLALGERNEQSIIYKPHHNLGGNSIVKVQVDKFNSEHAVTWEQEPVRVRVFDDWARERGLERIDFVKTDTEGHDYAVLKGVVPFLERSGSRPVILSELLSESLHHAWGEQVEVVERLYALGYRRVDIDPAREIQDILFVPEERARAV